MSQLSADVEKMNSFYDKIITAHDLLLKNGKHNVIRMLSGRKDGERHLVVELKRFMCQDPIESQD